MKEEIRLSLEAFSPSMRPAVRQIREEAARRRRAAQERIAQAQGRRSK